LIGCWQRRERERGLAVQKHKLGLDLKLWSGKKLGLEVLFPPCFSIALDKQPVHAINLRVVLKIPKPTLRHHLPNCWRSWGRGE
jgi:hypothetical protein